MVTSFQISVVTVSSYDGLVFQKVFVNAPDDARSCARRFEEEHSEHYKAFDWQTTIRNY